MISMIIQMKIHFTILVCAAVLQSCHSARQVNRFDQVLSTEIRFDQDTVLVGQPTFVDFVLINNSAKSVFVEEGSGYRSGRQNSFDVRMVRNRTDTIEKIELFGFKGGRLSVREILPYEERIYRIFLPMWGVIEEEGVYQISIANSFHVSTTKSSNGDWNRKITTKANAAKFVVVKDEMRLGEFIEQLVHSIEVETHGRVLDGIGYATGETALGLDIKEPASQKMLERMSILLEVNDIRIVPFLIKCYEENKHISRYKAVYLLANYPQYHTAFETLVKALYGPSSSKCTIKGDSIELVRTASDIRQTAIMGIMKSELPIAKSILKQLSSEEYLFEMYYVLMGGEDLLAHDDYLEICTEYALDSSPAIRKAAQRRRKSLEGQR